MERKVLVAMAIGIFALMAIVVIEGTVMAGLSAEAQREAEQARQSLTGAERQIESTRTEIESLVSSRTDVLGGLAERENWAGTFAAAAQRVEAAKSKYDADVKALLEKDDREDSPKVLSMVSRLDAERREALRTVADLSGRAQEVIEFVDKKDEYFARAEEAGESLANFDLGPIRAKAEEAKTEFPDKESDVEERLSRVEQIPGQGAQLAAEVEVMASKPVDELSPAATLAQIERLTNLAERLPKDVASLSALYDQLFYSYDKILTDMDIREGQIVEFYHQYQVIRIDRDNERTETQDWFKVTKTVFNRHEKHLGMVIESKPKGVYDHEATQIASPPGYNYVGNSHYGRWENRNGSSFWVWYGQYSFMRQLFWGSRYEPIGRNRYDDYRSHRSSGRTYYGNDNGKPKYGTSGSYTSSRYQGSKYKRTGGFSNTQYKKSGGTYRGSRYSSSRSSSSRSYTRGSRRGGGSRSFGK